MVTRRPLCSSSPYSMLFLLLLELLLSLTSSTANCIPSNDAIEEIFAGDRYLPIPGSCCMKDVCGLDCPIPVPPPAPGYGIAVAVFVVISTLIGVSTFLFATDNAINFFVGGRNLNLFFITIALVGQSIDTSSLLGNVELAYRFSFWDGAAFPIGLGLSLIINGIFLAPHIQSDRVLTLPDVLAKRYGPTVEVMVSITTITSFVMLLAGNLFGFGLVTSYVWDISITQAIWVAATIIWAYTKTGGLLSIVYTDIFQVLMGMPGLLVMVYWFIANEEKHAPPPSIGFPGYVYPDSFGDGGACDAYNGTACEFKADSCCYNTTLWCPGYPHQSCERYDRGSYPYGDKNINSGQMSNPFALDPYPNSMFWSWATIIILSLGNLAAIDFQGRCMASRTPLTARVGCIVAGISTWMIGVPFAYLGAITRVYYGPDSVHSEFEADSCHVHLGLPTCAEWLPDVYGIIKLLSHHAPPILGGWCLIGIIAACMSTADGAILAMSTVVSNNLVRRLSPWFPSVNEMPTQLFICRVATMPTTLASAFVAARYHAPKSSGGSGYLLIVAFDIVLATVVVPLIGCFYAKNPSPRAAVVSVVGGAFTRLLMEFTIPKDGYLLLPYDHPAFLKYGTAASADVPAFIDTNATPWNPEEEPCDQELYKDYTGVDSLTSFFVALCLYLSIQFIEFRRSGVPLFSFPGDQPYTKDTGESFDDDYVQKKEKTEDKDSDVEEEANAPPPRQRRSGRRRPRSPGEHGGPNSEINV